MHFLKIVALCSLKNYICWQILLFLLFLYVLDDVSENTLGIGVNDCILIIGLDLGN